MGLLGHGLLAGTRVVGIVREWLRGGSDDTDGGQPEAWRYVPEVQDAG
jgi:hypothetical protein